MTLRPNQTTRSLSADRCVSFLCLMVALAAACSVDTGKLRAPTLRVPDAALDYPAVADAAEVGRDDADGGSDSPDADSASVRTDLPAAEEVAAPDAPSDLPQMDSAQDQVASDSAADSPDLATADEDAPVAGMDVGDGTGGAGGSGTGGAGTGGAGTGGGGSGGGGTGGAGGGGTGGAGTGGGGTGGGGTGGADPDLVLWYKFDESSGMTAADSSTAGGDAHPGTLATYGMGGSAVFSTNSQVGPRALSLTPSAYNPSSSGGYVTVPALQPLAPDALTIAVWVKPASATSSQTWARIFDFGSGTSTTAPYCYLTVRTDAANAPVRFGISASGRTTNMERLDGTSALTTNVWHHIAIVLPAGSPYTGLLYINGVVVATNDEMGLHLSDLATTTQNWLGRSQFSGSAGSDPFFSGSLDDFRVYKRALSQQEITNLFTLR